MKYSAPEACPHCGSDSIDLFSEQRHEGAIYEYWHCDECKGKHVIKYKVEEVFLGDPLDEDFQY